MIRLQELCAYLDELLQPTIFSDGCPNGLQVEGKNTIKTLATAVSASVATIEAAIKLNVDGLIVHHGMFWNRDSFVVSGSKRKKLELLLTNGLSLFGYHLPLDAHKQIGNNWKAAIDLGWENLEPFGAFGNTCIGVKGSFAPIKRDAFVEKLVHYYAHTAQVALGGPETVRNAALISGGAYRNIIEAASMGLDCFITGSFDEPVWHQAFEEKINFYALGHSNTERVGPQALAQHIQESLNIPCSFIDLPNPF